MTALQILTWIQLLAGIAAQHAGGKVGKDIQIGTDLLQVAQGVLALHGQLAGQTQDEVLASLHDLPPISLSLTQ